VCAADVLQRAHRACIWHGHGLALGAGSPPAAAGVHKRRGLSADVHTRRSLSAGPLCGSPPLPTSVRHGGALSRARARRVSRAVAPAPCRHRIAPPGAWRMSLLRNSSAAALEAGWAPGLARRAHGWECQRMCSSCANLPRFWTPFDAHRLECMRLLHAVPPDACWGQDMMFACACACAHNQERSPPLESTPTLLHCMASSVSRAVKVASCLLPPTV
jgi:hypothetical protein